MKKKKRKCEKCGKKDAEMIGVVANSWKYHCPHCYHITLYDDK